MQAGIRHLRAADENKAVQEIHRLRPDNFPQYSSAFINFQSD